MIGGVRSYGGGDASIGGVTVSPALGCVMPWKALYMDEVDGRVAALPCCLSWIGEDYGTVGTASLDELWNSEGAQKIRRLLASGRQHEICDPYCPYWMSGNYGESALRIVDGPAAFVANQRLNLEEIHERRSVLESRPMLLKVLPTLRCNIRCSMCFQDHFKALDSVDGIWGEIERQLPYIHEITFQGGEVTLDRGFRRFLESPALSANPHIRISLITNGTVLDAALLEALGRIRLNYVIVSVNAATAETYQAVTGKDLFRKVMENVNTWLDLGRQHQRGSFPVYLSFVVMRSNFLELPHFVRMANQLGAVLQLLHVIGDRCGEDIFVRLDQHEALARVLAEAAAVASGAAWDQVERIRRILETHRCGTAAPARTGTGGG